MPSVSENGIRLPWSQRFVLVVFAHFLDVKTMNKHDASPDYSLCTLFSGTVHLQKQLRLDHRRPQVRVQQSKQHQQSMWVI
jgi:hypothetical protein